MDRIFDKELELNGKSIGDDLRYIVDIEELYQAFKQRMVEELRVSSDELINYADIVDVSNEGE